MTETGRLEVTCTMSDVPELRQFFNKKLITNGEYLNDKDFEEATFKLQAKLQTAG